MAAWITGCLPVGFCCTISTVVCLLPFLHMPAANVWSTLLLSFLCSLCVWVWAYACNETHIEHKQKKSMRLTSLLHSLMSVHVYIIKGVSPYPDTIVIDSIVGHCQALKLNNKISQLIIWKDNGEPVSQAVVLPTTVMPTVTCHCTTEHQGHPLLCSPIGLKLFR